MSRAIRLTLTHPHLSRVSPSERGREAARAILSTNNTPDAEKNGYATIVHAVTTDASSTTRRSNLQYITHRVLNFTVHKNRVTEEARESDDPEQVFVVKGVAEIFVGEETGLNIENSFAQSANIFKFFEISITTLPTYNIWTIMFSYKRKKSFI